MKKQDKDAAESFLMEKLRRLSKDWTLEDIQQLNKEASRIWRKYHKIEDIECIGSVTR